MDYNHSQPFSRCVANPLVSVTHHFRLLKAKIGLTGCYILLEFVSHTEIPSTDLLIDCYSLYFIQPLL